MCIIDYIIYLGLALLIGCIIICILSHYLEEYPEEDHPEEDEIDEWLDLTPPEER